MKEPQSSVTTKTNASQVKDLQELPKLQDVQEQSQNAALQLSKRNPSSSYCSLKDTIWPKGKTIVVKIMNILFVSQILLNIFLLYRFYIDITQHVIQIEFEFLVIFAWIKSVLCLSIFLFFGFIQFVFKSITKRQGKYRFFIDVDNLSRRCCIVDYMFAITGIIGAFIVSLYGPTYVIVQETFKVI